MHSRRIDWIDYAKAVAIILIVASHIQHRLLKSGLCGSGGAYDFIDGLLYSFHVPLFFFLSGLFFYSSFLKRGLREFLTGKACTILYPFVVWSLFQTAVEVILKSASPSALMTCLYYPRAHFWFLYALFFMSVVSAVIYWKGGKLALPVCLAVSIVLLLTYRSVNYGPFSDFAKNFIYFALGILACRTGLMGMKKSMPLWNAVMATGQFVVLEVWFLTNGWHTTLAGQFLLAVSGTLFVVTLCMVLNDVAMPWLKYIGRRTLPIYVAHVLVAYAVMTLMGRLVKTDSLALYAAVGMLAGTGIPLIMYAVANRLRFPYIFELPRKK